MNGRDGIYLTPMHFQFSTISQKEFVTLPETNETNSLPLKMDAWKTFSFPFWGLAGLFSGANLLLLVGGWTNPSEKYAQVKLEIFPKVRGENKKYLSCHHLG